MCMTRGCLHDFSDSLPAWLYAGLCTLTGLALQCYILALNAAVINTRGAESGTPGTDLSLYQEEELAWMTLHSFLLQKKVLIF
jgi:hypothetical protein